MILQLILVLFVVVMPDLGGSQQQQEYDRIKLAAYRDIWKEQKQHDKLTQLSKSHKVGVLNN